LTIWQAQAEYVVQQTVPMAPQLGVGYPTAPHTASAYPSLETSSNGAPSPGPYTTGAAYPGLDVRGGAYPGLAEYMGMELSREMIAANMPEYLPENQVNP